VDTATQALLGAVVGQAGFSHKLGRRAVVWGAVGGLLPDLDVLAVVTHGPFGEFLYHRGFTHALWFGPALGPILGYAVWRFYARRLRVASEAPRDGSGAPVTAPPLPHPGERALLPAWIGLFVLALFTHPLIDVFTSYGTQLLAPFSNQRFALHAVGIIDVFYSGILVAALVAGRVLRGRAGTVRRVAFGALALSWAYLGFGYALNERARRDVAEWLAADGVVDAQVRVYPTILQPFLRRVVVRTETDVRVGLYTPWREAGPVWKLVGPAPAQPLVDALMQTPEGTIFAWFAMGEVVAHVEQLRDGFSVEIDDLRYGSLSDRGRGYWGIRGVFDPDGELRAPVEIVTFGRHESWSSALGGVWRAAWGDFSSLELRTDPARD
jgi:inner membrane protein